MQRLNLCACAWLCPGLAGVFIGAGLLQAQLTATWSEPIELELAPVHSIMLPPMTVNSTEYEDGLIMYFRSGPSDDEIWFWESDF